MSKPFLQEIAEHFAQVHSEELFKYRFFFQNRRSGLFFRHYLRQAIGSRPTLLPEITNVNEYLRKVLFLPEEDVNNDLFITFELCQVYNKLMTSEDDRSFNDFYNLGELILNDFNDIDKHLLDVDKVFRNVADYEKLVDDFTFLEEKQKDALKAFFGYDGFLKEPKPYQEKFMLFWEVLPQLYHETKSRLAKQGLHYDGMLLRDVVERIERDELDLLQDKKIPVFVGLNALTPCEKKLFNYFRDKGGALFYWDFVSDLLQKDSLAGAFYGNQYDYPMPSEGSDDYIEFAPTPAPDEQEVDLVAIPSEVAQSVYVGEVLKEKLHHSDIDELKVAVVLPSERLLIPLLSNIPSELPSLNVTMGSPIHELPHVSMLIRLLELRMLYRRRKSEWRGEEIREILSMNQLSEILGEGDFASRCVKKIVDEGWYFLSSQKLRTEIFDKIEHTELQEQLITLLFRDIDESGEQLLTWVTEIVAHLSSMLEAAEDEEGKKVYSNAASVLPFLEDLLMKQRDSMVFFSRKHADVQEEVFSYEVMNDLLLTLLRQSRIPYMGEPLKGLQVMGILETRGLDFETLIIPDAAENILPAKTRLMGVIPHTIRYGLNMPTYKWQDQTRAYNFFRLISRAKRIITTFDTRRGDHSGGEPSRYIQLLEHIYGRKVTKINANFPLLFSLQKNTFIRDQEKINEFVDRITSADEGKLNLSASRLNDYFHCPRRFYYKNILGIEEREEMDELISDRDLGTLVHNTAELLYRPFVGRVMDKGEIQKWLDDGNEIKDKLTEAYRNKFKRNPDQITGMNAITFNYAESLVRGVLEWDVQSEKEIHYIGGEVRFEYPFEIEGSDVSVNLKGYIDRLDYIVEDGKTVLRVIDYKTGKDKLEYSLDAVNGSGDLNKAALQLFFYSYFLSDTALAKLVIRDSEVGELLPKCSYSVRPLLFKPKLINDGLLVDQSAELLDFSSIKQDYYDILCPKLSEITNRENPYPTVVRSSGCNYCPANTICSKEKIKKL